jgi:hypothetical protein
MRKPLIVFLGALGLFLIGTGLVLFWLDDRVSEDSYCRIENGMNQSEVAAILGTPTKEPKPPGAKIETHHWHGDVYQITVWFDEEGLVVGKSSEWRVAGKQTPSLRKRLRTLLGL